MGGRACASFGAERISSDAYWDIRSLLDELNCKMFYIQDGFNGKASFGDMDILCLHSADQTLNYFLKLFHMKYGHVEELGRVRNGNCLSVCLKVGVYPPFQFDFISLTGLGPEVDAFTRWDAFKFHALFLQSDFGALIGNILRPYGLCYTHEGLYAEIEHRGSTERECITKDVDKLREFLHLEHKRISPDFTYDYYAFSSFRPFNCQEALYEIVAKVPYITADYLGERVLNHKERHREKSRPIFANFKDWYEINGDKTKTCSLEEVHKKLKEILGFDYGVFEAEVKERIDKRIAVREFFTKHLGELRDDEKRVAFPLARHCFSEEMVLEFIRKGTSPFWETKTHIQWNHPEGGYCAFFKKTV